MVVTARFIKRIWNMAENMSKRMVWGGVSCSGQTEAKRAQYLNQTLPVGSKD